MERSFPSPGKKCSSSHGQSDSPNVRHGCCWSGICQNSFIRGKSLSIEPSLPGMSPLFSGVCKASEIRTQGSPPAEERDLTDPEHRRQALHQALITDQMRKLRPPIAADLFPIKVLAGAVIRVL